MSAPLSAQVTELFRRVNGEHAMTDADDAYVDEHFTALPALCEKHGVDVERLRADMLARRVPLPSYLRSDGTEMVPFAYFSVIEAAGGIDGLQSWFRAHWPSDGRADTEWADFLDGHYLCLREPVPRAMRRKSELIDRIKDLVSAPRRDDVTWLSELHDLVDELDRVEQPFTGYDRLRFGGPVSREVFIDDVRLRYPRPAAAVRPPDS